MLVAIDARSSLVTTVRWSIDAHAASARPGTDSLATGGGRGERREARAGHGQAGAPAVSAMPSPGGIDRGRDEDGPRPAERRVAEMVSLPRRPARDLATRFPARSG